jgi:hypothetical protein
MKKLFSIIIISYFLLSAYFVFASVRESPSFRLQSDSINIGGFPQTSPSYRMEVTIGEIAGETMASPGFRLRAGFQHMQETFLSISAPADITMTPEILGMTGGTGNGTVTWRVTTDNRAGYTLRLRATASPALTRTAAPPADNFADYTPAIAGIPDAVWSVPSAASEFGFTVDGTDTVALFRRAAAAPATCNVAGGVDEIGKCWINTTSADLSISKRTIRTDVGGVDTAVGFRAQTTPGRHQLSGTYTAIITVTVIAN